jgi:NAD(P)-dependent dehydrogenase (short-subunit alcohol dehydrogenase family)
MTAANPLSPDGSTCIITGGVSGIGFAVAKRILSELRGPFTHCAILDRQRGRFDELSAPMDRATLVSCDVRNADSVTSAVAAIASWGPPITGLVNCAGVAHFVPTVDVQPEDWERVLDINVTGTLRVSNAVATRMRAQHGGSIVNLASVSGFFGWPRRAAYSASKAAVVSLTRTLAVEWAQDGIRVNAVAPGYVQTEMMEEIINGGNIDYDTYSKLAAMERFATPEEIAAPIAFLLSADASFITGVTLPVDGGFSATKVP